MTDNSGLFFKTYEVFNSIQTEYPKTLNSIFLYQKMFGSEENTLHYSECIKDKENFLRINQNLLIALRDFDAFLDNPDNL